MAPATMKAIKCTGQGKAEIQDVPLPRLRNDYVLVKVKAVALNPTDWKHINYIPTEGATVGCDFAGTVEAVGPKVTKQWKKGDRISGFTHGVNAVEKEDGCFAEYAVMKGDLGLPIPANLTDEEAATLGVGISTVGQGLYQGLQLPMPGQGKYGKPLLIYGASSATGTLAVQYAKLSGAEVIAVCSPRNFELVKKLGAVEAFDYNDPDCAKKIRDFTNDSLTKAYDCIAEGSSTKICEYAISSKGGEISHLLPVEKHERPDVKNEFKLGYTVTGERFTFAGGQEWPAKPEDFEFAKKWWELSEKLLADGSIKAHPPDIRSGGLKGVFGGMDDLKEGKVSGRKLVYNV